MTIGHDPTFVEPTPTGTKLSFVDNGPGFATENNLRAFTTLLYSAQRRLSITSPYFVPDESLLYAMAVAPGPAPVARAAVVGAAVTPRRRRRI